MASYETYYTRATAAGLGGSRRDDTCECGRHVPVGAAILWYSSNWKFDRAHQCVIACPGCDPDIEQKLTGVSDG